MKQNSVRAVEDEKSDGTASIQSYREAPLCNGWLQLASAGIRAARKTQRLQALPAQSLSAVGWKLGTSATPPALGALPGRVRNTIAIYI